MTGTQLHNRLKDIRINGKKIVFKKLADDLHMTPQQLHSKWKADTIKDSFITELANVLGIDEYELKDAKLSEDETHYSTSYKEKYTICMEENAHLREKIIELQQQLINHLQKE